MWEMVNSTIGQAVILVAVACMLGLVGFYLIRRTKSDELGDPSATSSELMTTFREIHHAGDLSSEEFQKIKAKLSGELQREINDSEKAG